MSWKFFKLSRFIKIYFTEYFTFENIKTFSQKISGTEENNEIIYKLQNLLYDVEISKKDIAFRESARLRDYYENEARIKGTYVNLINIS